MKHRPHIVRRGVALRATTSARPFTDFNPNANLFAFELQTSHLSPLSLSPWLKIGGVEKIATSPARPSNL